MSSHYNRQPPIYDPQLTITEPQPQSQESIDKQDAYDAHAASGPHHGDENPGFTEFNYIDCKEQIQHDLASMLSSEIGCQLSEDVLDKLTTQACQIVIDNFNKVSHHCKL